MGHIGEQGLKQLIKRNMITGLTSGDASICSMYAFLPSSVAKKFQKTSNRAKILLERVHSDVCGPIDPIAWDGSRYFVTFIDDYSHFAMIYTTKNKSDLFQATKEYEALVTARFN